MKKKNTGLDKNDLCYEDDCEEIGFDDPAKVIGTTISSFGFDDSLHMNSTVNSPKIFEAKKDIPDMRRVSIVNGATPPVDGEKLDVKRTYMLRFSTVKKLDQIKALHPDIVYVSSLVDLAISHYFDCISSKDSSKIL